MNILLATYNFYPFHWGGSEIYVAGLAKYLLAHQKQVRIIAAVPDRAFIDYGLWWSGERLKVCQYIHQGIEVYGVLHPLDNEDIYRKDHPIWEADWQNFFLFLQEKHNWIPNLLHLHGFTAVIGLALVRAFRSRFIRVRIFASYHTPISCPKGTLLRWGKEECFITANANDCSTCTWQAKTQWPPSLAKLATTLLPSKTQLSLPTALRWKELNNKAILAFEELVTLVDQWWVFSEQISQVLVAQGIDSHKISLGRHGVDSIYTVPNGSVKRSSSPLIFAFVGRFKIIKGLRTLLEAWLKLTPTEERQLWLIGDTSDTDQEFLPLLAQLRVRSDVKILGSQTVTELVLLYQQIHTLVVPSTWVEIGPLVVHEALACGANVIGSALGGIKELSTYYPPGAIQLFPAGDVQALSQLLMHYQYAPFNCKVETQEEHYTKVYNWYFAEN